MSDRQLIHALLNGKPYFGPALRALQGPAIRLKYLSAIVRAICASTAEEPIEILEVGSWAGGSAVTLAATLKQLGRTGQLTCIDIWESYFNLEVDSEPTYVEMNQAAQDKQVFQLFLHNLRAADVSDMVDYKIGRSRDVLPTITEESFHIIYIDGSHIYEDVKSDIANAKPLLKSGGILCGDDLELSRSDVDELSHLNSLNLKKDYVSDQKTGRYYHPGVTEAVAVEFGTVSSWEGIWAVKKFGNSWRKVEIDISALDIQLPIIEDNIPTEITAIESTDHFNIFEVANRYFAIAKSLGPTDLLLERLGDRELAPLLFVANSIQEVRAKAIASEKQTSVPHIEFIEVLPQYNLIRAGDYFIAVAKKLGPVDLFRERLGNRELSPLILVSEDLATLRCRIAAKPNNSEQYL